MPKEKKKCVLKTNCKSGSFCLNKKCRTVLGVGQRCDMNNDCRTKKCAGPKGLKKCANQVEFSSCDKEHPCNDKFYCDINENICKTRRDAGIMGRPNYYCNDSTYCKPDTNCYNNYCSKGLEGHSCTSDSHCSKERNLFCNVNKCESKLNSCGSKGNPCGELSKCSRDGMCLSGKCRGSTQDNRYCSDGSTGSKCEESGDCEKTDYCLNYVCVNRPSPNNNKQCQTTGENICSSSGGKQAQCIKLN